MEKQLNYGKSMKETLSQQLSCFPSRTCLQILDEDDHFFAGRVIHGTCLVLS